MKVFLKYINNLTQTLGANAMKKLIRKEDIKAKSKEELENIVWELYVSYIVPQDTNVGQTNTFKRKFGKLEKADVHFTDIDNQKCRFVNRTLSI